MYIREKCIVKNVDKTHLLEKLYTRIIQQIKETWFWSCICHLYCLRQHLHSLLQSLLRFNLHSGEMDWKRSFVTKLYKQYAHYTNCHLQHVQTRYEPKQVETCRAFSSEWSRMLENARVFAGMFAPKWREGRRSVASSFDEN